MNTVQVDIVSAEHEIFSGEVEMVFAPALLGEVGIAPGHTPLVTQLGPNEVRVQHSDGKEEAFYVSGGLLEVQPKVVTRLSYCLILPAVTLPKMTVPTPFTSKQ